MPDKPDTRISLTQSGTIPRSLLEPLLDHEAPNPNELQKHHDENQNPITTTLSVVKEGEDNSAERDEDQVNDS